ncbi:transcriptional regulator GlxA family with amidase domain [Microbacterium resistens]|uniref:Transcriptional regulator GlxA family with amidase domain n=1 Tax=Microbacterium resistens TaxID=156977 RepID=A0ABU1S9Y2_9MICO|nr:helix-turn-helix domain-containing protein [Microbacterium resistens]MDR6866391.1 transcriptional regulator GlxA family with amidase domain [Microbacterium resistens]
MHKIVVVALPGVFPYELGIPGRFFRAAHRDGEPLYSVTTCSLDGGPVPTNADFSITTTADRSALETADTIIVPPWTGAETSEDPIGLSRFADRRVVSYCTGAFTVAASGLLDDQEATTHWCAADEFARRFPRVRMRRDELFVDNGHVVTAAGASAAVDATLHLIGRDHGAAVAATVSQITLAAPHRGGGQRQFIARPVIAPTATGSASDIQEWLVDRIDEPLSLSTVADEFGMSVRTLTRRFRAETGRTMGDWFSDARVDRARELLETTDLPVDSIAARSGFATSAALRKHFRDRVGLAPQQYRTRFTRSAG